jgi:hypothetical protein
MVRDDEAVGLDGVGVGFEIYVGQPQRHLHMVDRRSSQRCSLRQVEVSEHVDGDSN